MGCGRIQYMTLPRVLRNSSGLSWQAAADAMRAKSPLYRPLESVLVSGLDTRIMDALSPPSRTVLGPSLLVVTVILAWLGLSAAIYYLVMW